MTAKKAATAKLSAREQVEFEQASRAYEERPAPIDSASALIGPSAAAAGRALLEDALGGPSAVERALGGRPPLSPDAPRGHRSPVRSLRLPVELSRQLDEVAELEGRRASEVMRDALAQYLAGYRAI